MSAKELKNVPLCLANIAYNISKVQLQQISIKKVRPIQRLTFFFAGHGSLSEKKTGSKILIRNIKSRFDFFRGILANRETGF